MKIVSLAFALLLASHGFAVAELVKVVDFSRLSTHLAQPAFAEGAEAKALFEQLGGTRYIVNPGSGISTFVSTSARVGNGIACFSTFNERTTTYRCYHVVGDLLLP